MLRRSLPYLIILGLAGCSDPSGPTATGTWGGPGASLILAPAGGTLGYFCGTGTIDSGWTLASDGHFAGTGEHFFGGGPLPPQGHPSHPAVYTGQIRGETLVLTVTLTDLEQVLGPFQLRRGGPVVAEQCD